MTGLLEQYHVVLETGRRSQRRRLLTPVEERSTSEVAALFSRQGRAFRGELALMRQTFVESHHRRLKEAPTRDQWDRAWDRAAAGIRADFADAMDVMASKGLKIGFDSIAATLEIDLSFSLQNPRAVAFMQQRGGNLISGIDATTRDQLRTILTDSIEKGWSYQRTANAIIERFRSFSVGSPLQHIRSRAELISVTENAMAYEQGSRMAAEQIRANLPASLRGGMVKSWITAGDDRVDEFPCNASEADGWIPMDEEFSGGFMEPPAHPGCRCTASYASGV